MFILLLLFYTVTVLIRLCAKSKSLLYTAYFIKFSFVSGMCSLVIIQFSRALIVFN